ncbi:MAG: response regulator [Anaerolineae bacterium]|jgi:two-component system alkaline phosphatase synthesis response regulator PhoP|nr:response regulator [Anaerolineae bacterium]
MILPTHPTTAPKRILIVDDNPDLLTIFSVGLEDEAFDIHTAVDGVDAMDKIREVCPDVLILDVNMPRMDGLEVLSALRNTPEYQHLKIILITGDSTVPGFPESGAADLVLSKPVSVMELAQLTRRLAG